MGVTACLAVLFALAGCGLVDRVIDADGTVYDCGRGVELCYFADSAGELSDLTGRVCSASTIWDRDRWWPSLTNAVGRGCVFSCPPPPSGCNAKQGCYCGQALP